MVGSALAGSSATGRRRSRRRFSLFALTLGLDLDALSFFRWRREGRAESRRSSSQHSRCNWLISARLCLVLGTRTSGEAARSRPGRFLSSVPVVRARSAWSCRTVLYHPVRMPRQKIQSRTRKVRRVVEITEHRCQWCGQWFETVRKVARYCPQPRTCRIQAHQARREKLAGRS